MAKKLTINAVAMGNLRHRKKQYIALVIGVVLAMIFSCGVPFFLSCSQSSQQEIKDRQMGRQDLMIMDASGEAIQAVEDGNYLNSPAGYLHVLAYGWTEEQEKGTPIGWLDDQAEALYYLQILDGRMPEKPGEIAIEQSQLLRMGLENAKIGQSVSLSELPANESQYLSQQIEKTYTLVGILDNRKTNIEQLQGDARSLSAKLPGAYVSDQERVELGGKENLIALLDVIEWDQITFRFLEEHLSENLKLYTEYVALHENLLNKVSNSTKLATALALLLAFLSSFGIANAFASNLKERKKQIGLLRAVGATRRQIIQVFGREAVMIALICTPLSVVSAYFGVKLFAHMMGDYFVFIPSIPILLMGAAFGFVVVILSALIPLLAVSKIPPMQAIRDTELVRKMKRRKVQSQHAFQMDRLLAKRKMMFQRGRQIAVSLILAFTVIVLFIAVGQEIQTAENFANLQDEADYKISVKSRISEGSAFENKPHLNDTISETQRQEALLLPGVERISGQKRSMINILIEGEYPEYLELNEYASWEGASRFLREEQKIQELNRENLHERFQATPNPAYEEIRQWAGYEQELFAALFEAQTADMLQQLQSSVMEGSIDIQKLDAGEEVILYAPQKIGYFFFRKENGFNYGLMDLTDIGIEKMHASMKKNMEYLLAEAESPFHVGDTITLSMLVRGADGQPIRQDREVRIGAIVGNTDHSVPYLDTEFCIFTTIAGLDQFGQTFGYDTLRLNLSREVTPEIDRQMQSALEAIFPGKRIESSFARKELYLTSFRTEMAMASALILVLCTVSISLVNNSISAQIREGKRTIGTLRAVGASQRDITRSYVRQIFHMTVVGVVLGTVVYCIGNLIWFRVYAETIGEFVLWPAPILFVVIFGICYVHLRLQIRKVSRQSIVENIREL